MPLWLLIAAIFIPQEFASSAVVLVLGLQQHFPIWAINVIWAGATFLDVYIGFAIGKFAQHKLKDTRFGRWAERIVGRFRRAVGTHGTRLSFTLLAAFNFPYLNAFIGAWLGFSFAQTAILTFIGNFLWLLVLWGTVLGLSTFVHSPDIIILILVAVGVLSHFLLKFSKANKG